MKGALFMLLVILVQPVLYAQQETASFHTMQQLEELSQKSALDEDDPYTANLLYLTRHPLNLNTASKEKLEELGLLTEIQISQFLVYRQLLGNLLSLYELQAVPGWNLGDIDKVLPFLTITDAVTIKQGITQRWKGGEQSLLLRYGRTLEKAAGYSGGAAGSHYTGSPGKLYMRYQFRNKDKLQFGLLGEKDAGEQFFRRKQRAGFDFYSFHLFTGRAGAIKALVLGDYTVNMGQGLIQWQGMTLGMGAGLVTTEKQSSILHPYSSPGEVSFYRGAGITLKKRNWELTGFFSSRHIDATIRMEAGNHEYISTVLTSGYHRTTSELLAKNNIRQQTSGAACRYDAGKLQLALNAVHHTLSKPLQKDDQPYNFFAAKGTSFANASFSYVYTCRNLHLFGEWATDKDFHKAAINGLLLSLDPKADIAIVHRTLGRDYHALYASAFTQSAAASNEKGLYAGITFRPTDRVTADAGADLYRFPWLKYRVDAPSYGKEYRLQVSYKPDKKVELTGSYRCESRPLNSTSADSVISGVSQVERRSWLVQLSIVMNRTFRWQSRCEMVEYNKHMPDHEQGFLLYTELFYKPANSPFSANARLQYFETGGYNARLYAYENSVLYGFSIPSFSDKGLRYYGNMHFNASRLFGSKIPPQVNCWLRWAQTVYAGKKTISDGYDQIEGNKKTELTLQVIISK